MIWKSFDRFINRLSPKLKRLMINYDYWDVDQLKEELPNIYIYDLPAKFKLTQELSLVSETYSALYDFFRLYCRTFNPEDADYFFVPLNLIQYQFRNENPEDVLNYLTYFNPTRHDHLLVALGDFSNRSKKNHYGKAYLEVYNWLDKFVLLALESTSDLIPNQDIGIIPYNTLITEPIFNRNKRPYLYSFFGEISHVYLPPTHIRSQIKLIPPKQDVFVGSKLSRDLRTKLRNNYFSRNDYELISRNSVFTLAPAGYGRWTYRFFQAIQWGSIPVLISDDYIKPFEDSIPYESFCITVPEKEVSNLDEFLRSFSECEITEFQNSLAENQYHFTQAAFFCKLCNRLHHQIQN